jgi:hypothetical protein
MKIILGTLTGLALLAGIAAAQPAQARCWWNGYAWNCAQAHAWSYRHHWRHHHYRGEGWRFER